LVNNSIADKFPGTPDPPPIGALVEGHSSELYAQSTAGL
jgi:hypothetical protein